MLTSAFSLDANLSWKLKVALSLVEIFEMIWFDAASNKFKVMSHKFVL